MLLPPVQVHNAVAPPVTTAGVMDNMLVEGSNTTLDLNASCGGDSPVNSPTMSPILTADEHNDESMHINNITRPKLTPLGAK